MSHIPETLHFLPLTFSESSRIRYVKATSHVQADFDGILDNSILPFKSVKRIITVTFKNCTKSNVKKFTSLAKFARKTVLNVGIVNQSSKSNQSISQIVDYLPSLERLAVPLAFGNKLKSCKKLRDLSFKSLREPIALSKLLYHSQVLSNLQRLELPLHSNDQGLQALEEIRSSMGTRKCQIAVTFVNAILKEPRTKNQQVKDQEDKIQCFDHLAEATFKLASKSFWLLSHPECAVNLRILNFVAVSGCNQVAFEKLNQFQHLTSLILKLNLKPEHYSEFFRHCTLPASLQTLNLDFGDMMLTKVLCPGTKVSPKEILGQFTKNLDQMTDLQNLKLTLCGSQEDLNENVRFACLFLTKKNLKKVHLVLGRPEEQPTLSRVVTKPGGSLNAKKQSLGLPEILMALSSSSSSLKVLNIDSPLLDLKSNDSLPTFKCLENFSINSPNSKCPFEEFKLFDSVLSKTLKRLSINGNIEISAAQVAEVFGKVTNLEYLKDFSLNLSIDKPSGLEPATISETLQALRFLETFNIYLKNYSLGIKSLCELRNMLQPQVWRWKSFVLAFKNRIIRMKTRGEVSVDSLNIPKDNKKRLEETNPGISFQLVV